MPLKAIAIPSMPFKIRGFLRCHQFLFSIPYVPFPSLFSQAASAASRPYPFLQFRQATRAEARRLQVPPAISPVPFLSGYCSCWRPTAVSVDFFLFRSCCGDG